VGRRRAFRPLSPLSRYSAQNAATQDELTAACLRLLAMDAIPETARNRLLVLDAGCGSGLSTAGLAARGVVPALALDVAPAMLAAAGPAARGRAVVSDLGTAWPVAPRGACDGVVSVSVLHWLAHAAAPGAALAAFYAGAARALPPGGPLVAQAYPRTDKEAAALAAAASAAGFAARLVVDVPHAKGAARKTFVAALAPGGGARLAAVVAAGPPGDCPAAWPRGGTTCALWWEAAVGVELRRRWGLPPVAGGDSRMAREHAHGAARLARVVRRAAALAARAPAGARDRVDVAVPCGPCACGAPLLVSVACARGALGERGAALASALGGGDAASTPLPPTATPPPPDAAVDVSLQPTDAPGVHLLAAPGVARYLVAAVAPPTTPPLADLAAAVAVVVARATAAAIATGLGLYLVVADAGAGDGGDAPPPLAARAAFHRSNAANDPAAVAADALALQAALEDVDKGAG